MTCLGGSRKLAFARGSASWAGKQLCDESVVDHVRLEGLMERYVGSVRERPACTARLATGNGLFCKCFSRTVVLLGLLVIHSHHSRNKFRM